jgi:hypothetical protein
MRKENRSTEYLCFKDNDKDEEHQDEDSNCYCRSCIWHVK